MLLPFTALIVWSQTFFLNQFILAVLIEYKNISKKTLEESIKSEMSGNLEKLLVAIGEEMFWSSFTVPPFLDF